MRAEDVIGAAFALAAIAWLIYGIVRATCCLVPGVKGLSENIRVRNIVGRFLEHDRIYLFDNGGSPLLFCGSADWMTRNFFRRVEVLFPIHDPELRKRIVDEIVPTYLGDNEDARMLQPNGTYVHSPRPEGTPPFSAQKFFMETAIARAHTAIAVATD